MVAIRSAVKRTQWDTPLVLIDTETGRLCDEHERMNQFEADPKFMELVAHQSSRPRILPIRHVLPYLGRSGTDIPRCPSRISTQTGSNTHSLEIGDVLYHGAGSRAALCMV